MMARTARTSAGFTLVEVLVASLILGGALLALASLFAMGIKNNSVAKEDTAMATLAQDKLEELRRVPRSVLAQFFVTACQGPCAVPCAAAANTQASCYPVACDDSAAKPFVYEKVEDPVPDPNPLDDIRETMYVRQWTIEKVNIGQPIGCVFKITVAVGSRFGLLAPKPQTGSSWRVASWQEVVGKAPYDQKANPRRVVVATFRAQG